MAPSKLALLVAIATTTGVAAAEPHPCPAALAPKLVAQYHRDKLSAKQIKIAACVWGNFAGPGWIVYHLAPRSAPEKGAEGLVTFVTDGGKLAATGMQSNDEAMTVEAVDLDGDGTDEIYATHRWRADGETNEEVVVARVHAEDVDTVWSKLFVFKRGGDAPADCSGKLSIKPAGRGKQLTIVSKATGYAELVEAHCLRDGTHQYQYVKGEVTELK